MAKRENIIFCIYLILITIFAFGCGQSQSPSGSTGGDRASYFPHQDGYSWRFINTSGDIMFSTFEGTKILNSKTTQIYKSYSIDHSGAIYTSEAYYLIDDSGFFEYPPEPMASYNIYFTWLSFPLEVNKTWDVVRSGSIATTAKILTKETVITPAGSFESYKVNYVTTNGTLETLNYNIWYGNHAGYVKTNSYGSTAESFLEWKNF